MNEIRKSKLFWSDGDQAVKIPSEFKLDGSEVTITKVNGSLIIEVDRPKPRTFREMLDQMETIDIEFPDVDEGLLPLDDIEL